ncbi:hypothetical protein G9A89_003213 [Geosiphon pyriformis]|nr:hypothetical protein G9A89_003213 [Geosiphon pyriformis]
MEKKCLVEETSFDFGKDGTMTDMDHNEMPKGPSMITKKALGKPLGKIDFLGCGNNGDALSDILLELPLLLKNLVLVSVKKSFTLNIGLDKAVVVKEILVETSAETVHTVLSVFGIIKLIKMQLVGLWQKAIVEFGEIDQADLAAVCWSILIEKDAIRVAKTNNDKELWNARDYHRALLYTLLIKTTAYNIWNFVDSVGEKTCMINCHSVTYVQARCAVVCFDSADSLDAVIDTTLVLKSMNLYWFCLSLSKCAKCGNLGHTSLDCSVSGNFSSSRLSCRMLSDVDKNRLAAIYAKCSAPVTRPVAFGGTLWASVVSGSSFPSLSGQSISSKNGFSEIKPTPLLFLEMNNRFATLERSLASLTKCVDKLAKRLDMSRPMVFQLSPGRQPLVTPLLQNQGVNIVMSKSLGVVTSDKTVVGAVVFNPSVVLKMEEMLKNFLVTVMNLLAKMDNTGQLKKKVQLWIANKFGGVCVFTSGLDLGYLSSGVVVVMNNSLAKHVYKVLEVPGWLISIKLLFKNKLSVSILGLYAGVSSAAQFSQADAINFLIARVVNESSFVILSGDFNKDGSHKCASFKKCFDLGLVNSLVGSLAARLPTWSNSRGVMRTIDYVFVSPNLVNAIVHHNVLDADTSLANTILFSNNFVSSMKASDLDALWDVIRRVMTLSAEETFKKKWFKGYDEIFTKESSRFHKLELLVSKIVKASWLSLHDEFTFLLNKWSGLDTVNVSLVNSLFVLGFHFNGIQSVLAKIRKTYRAFKLVKSGYALESQIRSAIDKRIKSFEFDKGHTIKSVLERSFRKVVLDHLVVNNELVLEPDLVKFKIDMIMEDWTRKCIVVDDISSDWSCQYLLLEYVFNEAFSGMMHPIKFKELLRVVSNLPDNKAASLSSISNKLWRHCDRLVLDMLLVLLNLCLSCELGVFMNTHPIALIETACKILSKILLDRISLACSSYNVLCEDNFSVLKDMTIQFPIFAVESVVEDALKKTGNSGLFYKTCRRVMTDFGLTAGYQVHDSLNQGEVFLPLLWHIFYDPLLCEVKRQESVCGYQLNLHFVVRTGCLESQAGLMLFFAAGAFVDNMIWVGSSQAATQYILDIVSEFFQLNNIAINNDKTMAISVNCRVEHSFLLISGWPILIAKKEESYHYLGIFLSTESLSKPSLAKAYVDIWLFANLVLRKAISDKHLKTFEQVQAESKSAFVVCFLNAVGILGCLFMHWSHDLQIYSWSPHHLLVFPFCINVNPSNNFLAGVICIFLEYDLSLEDLSTNAFHFWGGTLLSLVFGGPIYFSSLDILKSQEFGVIHNRLLGVDVDQFAVYTDGSFCNLGTFNMKTGTAVFLEDIGLSLGVEVSSLVSSIMTELQTVVLALECHHIVDFICEKNLNVSWHKMKSHFGVSGNKHVDVFAKTASSSV